MTNQSINSPDPELVHRRPRLLAPLPEGTEFEIPAPPTVEVAQPPQTAMMLVPILTTGSILIFGVISKQITLIILGLAVTVAAMLTPLLMYSGSKRSARARNEKRHQRYGEIIDDIAGQIQRASAAIHVALETAHPTPDALPDWISSGRLWERRGNDPDFLDVAVGVADVPSGLRVSVGQNTALEADVFTDLQDRAEAVTSEARTLKDAPFCLSLRKHSVLSVEAPRNRALALTQAMLLEAVVCCGPDELSLLVATPPRTEHDWDWAALIPHALQRTETSHAIPAIATDSKGLSLALARTVGHRTQLLVSSDISVADAGLAHIVIVLDDFHPLSELQEIPLLQEMLSRASDLEITVLTICDAPGSSPAEATAILTIDANGHAVMRPVRSSRESVRFQPLSAPAGVADKIASAISGRQLVTDLSFGGDSTNDLLLDLIGFRPLPAAPPSWHPLAPADFLTATFGVQADGRPFRLDLKEGAVGGDGPHGLLVGATGSGKSELLRSMVTALALTHSPEWLQMAFVDFKGGSAFESLAKLPHCVGMISNILEDLSLIDRMRNSLSGEMLARQRQLAKAGPDLQGIRDYWELRKTRSDLPPMPYLLVVIDEFAELLETEPAFLEVLLAIGRQGRSLGIHLILSSQRLEAGRIRGLESYLSYRIALRTFNADESSTAIGSKAAAELPPLAGHGYFRAADVFQRFKASQVSVDGGSSAVPAADGSPATDLAQVVDWLASVGKAPSLWLRPLPNTARAEFLAMDDDRLGTASSLVEAGLPVALGLLDDPQHRRQDAAILDTTRLAGHVAVIGAPQAGKSSAMATQVLQAARTYPPSLLRFFVLDFGGGLLAAARGLPNVGAYATPQEPDRVARVMAEMLTLLDERPLEFRREGVTSMARQRARAAAADGTVQAHTVLVIDNYAAFKERHPEHEPVVERVLIEGANFGLHLHLTSSRWTDISARKLEQIAIRIELRLNQPADSLYGRLKAAAIQTSGPGRALSTHGMQMQFAAPFLGRQSALLDRLEDTAAAVAGQAQLAWNGLRTPPLLLLHDLTAAGFRDAAEATPAGQVFLGVNESGFRPVVFEPGQSGNLLLFGDLDSGRTATLARIVSGLRAADPLGTEVDLYVVDFRGDLVSAVSQNAGPLEVATSPDEVEALVKNLHEQFGTRLEPEPRPGGSAARRPIMLVVDDFDLVQVLSTGKPSSLADLSQYLLLPQRLRFSVVVNQLAANSMIRAGDLVIKRALESGAWRMHFSVASRAEMLPGSYRGRRLPPGVATLIRPGQPDALVGTLSPEDHPLPAR